MTERKTRFPLRLPRSLDEKMLYMILLSFLCAAAVYFLAYGIGSYALRELYMSPEARSARLAEIYSEFYEFVNENQLKGTDTEAVAHWTREHPYVTILIYENEDANRTGNRTPAPNSGTGSGERLQYNSQYGRLYPMRFADGTYRIAIGDGSNVREDNINRVIAVILGSVAFFAIMLWYIRRLTNRIIRLSKEADDIGSGDLEAPITVQGEDELAMLAGEMDSMRKSVIERMGNERRAWEANSELITAISHDIRTPMTALIGYLGLLNEGSFADAEKEKQFISSAYDKAMELKDLTDELFKYFLVFGRSELEMNMEEYDGRLLLEQLLGETEFDLCDAGFTVQRIEFEGECTVRTDPLYIKRVVDNLLSNAKKYADRSQTLLILSELKDGKLSVSMSNAIAKGGPRVESTKIGLRTCEKIMDAMGGSFSTHIENGRFTAEFILPAEEMQALGSGQ